MSESQYKLIHYRDQEFNVNKIQLTKGTSLRVINQSQQQKCYFVLMYEKQIDSISSLVPNSSEWEFRFQKLGNYQLSCPLTPKSRPLLISVKQNLNGKSLFNYKEQLLNEFAQNQSTTVSDNKKKHRDHSSSRKKTELKTQFTYLQEKSGKASLEFCQFDSQQSNDCLSNQNQALQILNQQEEQKKTCLTDSQSKQKEFYIKAENTNTKPNNIKVSKQKKKGTPSLSNELFLQDIKFDSEKNEFKRCVNEFMRNNKNSSKKMNSRQYCNKSKIFLSYLSKRYSLIEFFQ